MSEPNDPRAVEIMRSLARMPVSAWSEKYPNHFEATVGGTEFRISYNKDEDGMVQISLHIGTAKGLLYSSKPHGSSRPNGPPEFELLDYCERLRGYFQAQRDNQRKQEERDREAKRNADLDDALKKLKGL